MAKKRLNKSHKTLLNSLVRKVVDIPEMRDKTNQAHKKADELILSELEKIYPKKDMDVLEKYESINGQISIRFIATSDDKKQVHHMQHDLERATRIPREHRHSSKLQINIESEAFEAIQQYKKIKADYKHKLKEKQLDYHNLIEGSRYFEDVIEVWEEANELKSEICGSSSALIAVSSDCIARIKKDVEQRKQSTKS